MLYDLIAQARSLGASDLHLHAGRPPLVRVLGKLQPLPYQPLTEKELLGFREELLDLVHRDQLDKQGETDLAFTDTLEGRCRANIYNACGRPSLAIRLINPQVPGWEELGLPVVVKYLANLSQGLVLVTGPTGSGKSTTLAAMIEMLNQEQELHIITLEDPIEYLYSPGGCLIDQREIGRDTEDFTSGLRSCLRQDPDVILVGELRDRETMEVALAAAETGHLVLATLHTMGAVATVDRIMDAFPQKEQIRSQLAVCLQGIISQQLVPAKDGKSRVAAFEILVATDALRNLIREGKSHQLKSYMETGSKQGMITMEKALQQLRQSGRI